MLRGLDPDGVRFIGIGNPVFRRVLRAAEVHVTLNRLMQNPVNDGANYLS